MWENHGWSHAVAAATPPPRSGTWWYDGTTRSSLFPIWARSHYGVRDSASFRLLMISRARERTPDASALN